VEPSISNTGHDWVEIPNKASLARASYTFSTHRGRGSSSTRNANVFGEPRLVRAVLVIRYWVYWSLKSFWEFLQRGMVKRWTVAILKENVCEEETPISTSHVSKKWKIVLVDFTIFSSSNYTSEIRINVSFGTGNIIDPCAAGSFRDSAIETQRSIKHT